MKVTVSLLQRDSKACGQHVEVLLLIRTHQTLTRQFALIIFLTLGKTDISK